MAEIKDPMKDTDDRSSREIRDDIRRTRAQMDATVDAIEDKLSPGELIHEAWGLFRGGSSSSVNRVIRIAKQHPMPAAIIGLGLGWMVYESTGGTATGTRRARYVRYDDEWSAEGEVPTALESARRRAAGTARRASDAAGSTMDKASGLVDDAGEMASDVAGSVRRATETAGERVGELAGQAREMASDVAGSVRRQASELGGQARRGMHDARAGFWETLEEQPLVVGAATLAAGLLVGLLLPSTEHEDELMGKTRDSLLDEVKGLGEEALETGKQIASAAADTLTQSAQTLTGEMRSEEFRAPRPETPQPPSHRAA
jgi:Protein of unknown function (DUF3618)